MILGVGIDIVDIERWARSLDRIQHEIFTSQELADCADRVDRVDALAARFAAKEAYLKALNTGIAGGALRQIEIVSGPEFYLEGGRFDLQRVTAAWNEKLRGALAKGYDGMRASGNAFWLDTNRWKDFADYEDQLDKSIAGQPMTVLCTYPLAASKPVDVLDVVRAHQFTAARRKGDWDFIETPQRRQSVPQLTLDMVRNSSGLSSLRAVIGRRIAGLTARERQILQSVVEGKSSKQIARRLGISQRTVENHRARFMKKIGARSLPELVRLTIIGSPDAV